MQGHKLPTLSIYRGKPLHSPFDLLAFDSFPSASTIDVNPSTSCRSFKRRGQSGYDSQKS